MLKVLRPTDIVPSSSIAGERPAFWNQGFALLIVGLATLLRMWLTPLVGPSVPFILYFPAVMVAGWFGGMRPGLTATVASGFIAWYLFIPPVRSFAVPTPAVLFQLSVFLLSGALLSFLNGALHRARQSAEEQARLLARQQEEILRTGAERARLLEEARQAHRQAEEASRVKDQFLAVVSHELRTPLNAILGWGQLLLSDPSDPARSRHGLEAIVRNGRHQSQLIDDLLDVSRIVSGKMRLDVRLLEPARVVDAAVEAIRPAAEAKQIQLRTVLDPQAGPVAGDADRLQQVVWHLLNNAVKFTPQQGTVEVRVERLGAENGLSVQLVVSDNGIGISPELLPSLFAPFRQLDSSTTRIYGGLGLGLSIVRNLVELHGGTVEARSAGANQGTSVLIRLPVARIESQDKETDEVPIPRGRRTPAPPLNRGGLESGGTRPPSPPGSA